MGCALVEHFRENKLSGICLFDQTQMIWSWLVIEGVARACQDVTCPVGKYQAQVLSKLVATWVGVQPTRTLSHRPTRLWGRDTATRETPVHAPH